MSRVAVIDIGSNSIKCLVATRNLDQQLIPVFEKTLPARISTGISAKNPLLSPLSIQRGVDAVHELLQSIVAHHPIDAFRLVATSAVRDAQNQSDFIKALSSIGAPPLQILSGKEEATWIAQGILEDPSLPKNLSAPSIIDLGGGSLEIIALVNRRITAKVSLPLGAVRLTEMFRPSPSEPLTALEIQAIREHTRRQLKQSSICFNQPLIATGGMVTTWRAMTDPTTQKINSIPPCLKKATLSSWIELLQKQTWEDRLSLPGLPPSRADIFPTGIVILDTLMDYAQAETLTHSFYNLRYGLAAHLLKNQ